jgi:hypothetical protein
MKADTAQSVILTTVLFGPDGRARDALSALLDEVDVIDVSTNQVRSLRKAGVKALMNKIAEASVELLGIDLLDAVIAGWRKHSALVRAAEDTASTFEPEIVQLATHRMTLLYRPYIDLMVEDVVVTTLHLEAEVEVTIQALVATVERGKLTELHSGDCLLNTKLLAEGIEIARAQGHIDLPLTIELADGLQLLPYQPS